METWMWEWHGLELGGYWCGAWSAPWIRGWEIAGWCRIWDRFTRVSLERLRRETEPVTWTLKVSTERPGKEATQ